MQDGGGSLNGSIVINEPTTVARTEEGPQLNSAEKRSVQADADYARQLQAKMDVQEARAAYRSAAYEQEHRAHKFCNTD